MRRTCRDRADAGEAMKSAPCDDRLGRREVASSGQAEARRSAGSPTRRTGQRRRGRRSIGPRNDQVEGAARPADPQSPNRAARGAPRVIAHGEGAPLFLGPRGATLRYSWWRRRIWVPACQAVGVDAPIHALRHSAGKALAHSGATPMMIKSFMGHASAAFSMDVYGHTSDDDLTATAKLLDAYRARSS